MCAQGNDFFSWWQRHDQLEAASSTRSTLDEEREFWRHRAASYDEIGSLARAAPGLVDRLTRLVWPDATVFEVGAGTGEFTVPLAHVVRHITAVDLSADMLALLRRKLKTAKLRNVTLIEGDWEDTSYSPHDIVLAVNSLYRLRHPRRSLTDLIHGALRRGIIVSSVGPNPPPPPEAVEQFGRDRYSLGSRHGLLVAGLSELGVAVNVEIVPVPRTYSFLSLAQAAESLAPWRNRTSRELAAAERIARRTMQAQDDGRVLYRYDGQVAILAWGAGPESSQKASLNDTAPVTPV